MFMTGKELCRIMRQHKVTIRDLAARMKITLKTIRRHREVGIGMPGLLDFTEAIRGHLTPEERTALNIYRQEYLS